MKVKFLNIRKSTVFELNSILLVVKKKNNRVLSVPIFFSEFV